MEFVFTCEENAMIPKFLFIVAGVVCILALAGTVEPTTAGSCNPAIQTC